MSLVLRSTLPALLLIGLAIGSANAQTAGDEEAIRQIEVGYNAAWNQHGTAGMVESLVEDAQLLTVTGAWMKSAPNSSAFRSDSKADHSRTANARRLS
jgi:hypothetical protein